MLAGALGTAPPCPLHHFASCGGASQGADFHTALLMSLTAAANTGEPEEYEFGLRLERLFDH